MTVEAVTYISDLNPLYPGAGDNPSEGDDHMRNLKTGIKNTFPNVNGAVNPSPTDLNQLTGAKVGTFLLSTQTAASVATIDFTTLIDGTHDAYELHIINALPATNGVDGWLLTSANAGVAWDNASSNYDWSDITGINGTVASVNASTTTLAQRIALSGGNNVGNSAQWGGLCAVVRFFQPASTTTNKRFLWSGTCDAATATGSTMTFTGSGCRVATAAINGVRFLFSSGNITSGVFKLYGIRQ